MKFLNKRIIAVLMTFAMLSCSDEFLELTTQQSVANEFALTNLSDFQSSITAVYNAMSSSNYYGRYFFLVPDVMSDDVKQNSQANRVKEYAEYVANVSNGTAAALWEDMYEAINACNTLINSDVTVPDGVVAERDHIIAEAYALRGIVYFDMVRMFAQHYTFTAGAGHLGVPIVLEFDVNAEPSRNTVAEVYSQAISDMLAGIAGMDASSRSGDSNTISPMAVKGLLSRVYLYMEDWTNAEAMATDVISNGGYSLVDNAGYVASWSNDNSSESLFEISMTTTDNRGSDALGRMYMVEGYGDYLPSDDVVSLIPVGDARLGVFKADPVLTGNFGPIRMNKYPTVTSEDNTKVMRLSEVYLIRAEARSETGNDTGAQADVDMIRQRGLPAAAAVTATGQALKDEIALERRIELCFEGQRLWDLMRKKQDMVRVQCTSPETCSVSYPDDRFIMPIPEDELDANPNIEPNPGYTN